jgi:hypothetical protein
MKNEKAYLKQVLNNSMEEDVYYQKAGKGSKFSKSKKTPIKKEKFKRESFDDFDYGDDFRKGKK